ARSGRECTVNGQCGRLEIVADVPVTVGRSVVVAIRPEAIEISTDPPTSAAANECTGVVESLAFLGDAIDHVVSVNGLELRVRGSPMLSIPQGAKVTLRMPPEALTLVSVD
ncbi:MAG TPA: TOBE domain-containing protein, partial [Micromonosporaceae bacterium]|nr:TOBE domain-containing protein [Micromonosporaceae bacterium]